MDVVTLVAGAGIGLFGTTLYRLIQVQKRVTTLEGEIAQRNERLAELSKSLALGEAEILRLKAERGEFSQAAEELKERMRLEFSNQHRNFLDESAKKLSEWSKTNLGEIVAPVDQELKALKLRVQEVYDREARERISLKHEIEHMMRAQQQMTLEAQSLTKALRGDSRSQGVWGEMVLERILESSGLREGEEFVVQGRGLGLTNEAGEKLRPDVLIRLPEGRNLIIDSKVSLVSFEAYTRAEADEQKSRAARDFVASVRRHVEELGRKDYPHLYGVHSPDFVLMFMPTDGAFALAHQIDPDLFHWAMERKVAVVSPSLLFPNLRTVEAIWRQEKQNQNAEEIAKQAGLLYDKFVSLIEDMQGLGNHLERAKQARESILERLRDGRGNILDKVEKLRVLGAKTKKKLPESLKRDESSDSSADA